jgi:hypothetical protein
MRGVRTRAGRRALSIACTLLLLAVPCARAIAQERTAQAPGPRSPFGALVRVYVGKVRLEGELLAVSADSVWLLANRELVGEQVDRVQRISLRRHNRGGKIGLIVGGVASGVTGVLMAIACHRYDSSQSVGGATIDSGCGGVGASFLAAGGLLTGVSALLMEHNAWKNLRVTPTAELAPYARFPQGLPPQFPQRSP